VANNYQWIDCFLYKYTLLGAGGQHLTFPTIDLSAFSIIEQKHMKTQKGSNEKMRPVHRLQHNLGITISFTTRA
jgi:hypothetical protein